MRVTLWMVLLGFQFWMRSQTGRELDAAEVEHELIGMAAQVDSVDRLGRARGMNQISAEVPGMNRLSRLEERHNPGSTLDGQKDSP